MAQGLLIIMASRSRLDTPHSVGLLLTSDRPVAGTSLTDTTRHNTYKRQTYIPPVVFEPAITASERPQSHALDRVSPGIG